MSKLRILISGICGNSYGAQIAKSLTLLNNNYELFGADASISKLPDTIKVEKISQFPKASSESFLSTLARFYHDNSIDYYIEGSEAEQIVLNDKRSDLSKLKINWVSNNQETLGICLDKRKLGNFLEESGFFTPKIFTLSEIEKFPCLFPVILKPYSQSSGSNNVYIAQDIKDVYSILHLSRKNADDYMIQEYVGTNDAEYTIGILHNNKGIFIGSATLKRDLSQPLSVKYTIDNSTTKYELGQKLTISSGFSQGLLHRNQKIEDYCTEIAEKLKSTGPLNFQGRMVGKKFYIFEINPRFSGTSFMRALSEFNESDLFIKNLNKKKCNHPYFVNSETKYKRLINEVKDIE